MLNIAHLRRLRDVLVAEGETCSHHLLTESGWTTEYIESPEEYDHARWLLQLSYLYHVDVLKRNPAGAEEFADVETELATLSLSDGARAVFDRR